MFWKELVGGRGDLLDLPPAKPASAAIHLYLLAIRTFGAVIRIKSLIGQYFSDIDYLSPKFHVTNLSFKESPPLKTEFPIHRSLEKRPKEWILQLSTPGLVLFWLNVNKIAKFRSWSKFDKLVCCLSDPVPAAGLSQRRGPLRRVARRLAPLHRRHRGRLPPHLEGLPRQRQTSPRRTGTECRSNLSSCGFVASVTGVTVYSWPWS